MSTDRCPTCHRRNRRSGQANARYWALLNAIADKVEVSGEHFAADVWHKWAKKRWLGAAEVRLPSQRVLIIPKSTADLDVAQFADYMTKVEVWAGEHGAHLDGEEIAA